MIFLAVLNYSLYFCHEVVLSVSFCVILGLFCLHHSSLCVSLKMVKKIIFSIKLALLLILFFHTSLKSALAECEGENCFYCTYNGVFCVVDLAGPGCEGGALHNEQLCRQYDGLQDACNQASFDCIYDEPEPVCYICGDAGNCFPRDAGDPRCEYPDWESCQAACTGQAPPGPGDTPFGPAKGICSSDPESGLIDDGIQTAIGCISIYGPEALAGSILKVAIGIGGGIAFLLILLGAFQIILSSGNPDKIQAGKELITAAVSGLLLIIFSVFILRIIGVEILQIPDLG